MPYLGNIPATQFAELKYQDFTGGTGTSFTLNDPVGSAQELEVFVNNVRQEPGVAYTVSGTTLTMTGSIVATDDFYVVFQGKSTGTATHPAGQALTATDGTFTGDVSLGDNNKVQFGAGNDLQIYHNGGNSIIADVGTGDLYVAGDNLRLTNAALSEVYARGYANGKFSLFYDNSEKLATTSLGATVTGEEFVITDTSTDAAVGPTLDLYRNSSSPADSDLLGQIKFHGEDDAGNKDEFAKVRVQATDVSSGSEDATMAIQTKVGGADRERIKITSSETAFNDDGIDLDFRVESDNKNEALFVRGSDGHVGIGTSAPTNPLYINGDNDEGTIRIHSNILNQSGKYNGIIFSGESSHSKVGIFQVSDTLSYNRTKLVFATNSSANSDTVTPTSSARLTISNGGAVTVHGSLSKGSGSFRIDHPLPAKNSTHELVHSFIEGPQADLIYRGKVDLVAGSATVNIDTAAGMTDGTFVLLCGDVQCFTSNEDGWTAVKGSMSGNTLTITAEDNTCTDTISWMVIGERKDQHMLDTEWTDDNGKVIVEPLKETAE